MTRQAIHKAANKGRLPVAQTIRTNARRIRLIRSTDLIKYANESRWFAE